jgi:hypothetical protein
MAIKIHHTQRARAKKFGIELKIEENEVVAYRRSRPQASGVNAKAVLEEAISMIPSAAVAKLIRPAPKKEGEAEENESDGDSGKSIISNRYKEKYRSHEMSCGDDLSNAMAERFTVLDSEAGERRVDRAALQRFAEANDIWKPGYVRLNSGQLRMTIGNRVRGLMRKDLEVKW